VHSSSMRAAAAAIHHLWVQKGDDRRNARNGREAPEAVIINDATVALFYGHRIGRPQVTAFRYYPGLQRPSEDEPVRDKTVNIPTADGQMETFVVHPEESGPFAPVIIYMDVWGLRTELCDIARKVAVVGYYVLLPDLYYRQGRIRHEWRRRRRPNDLIAQT